MTSIYNSLAVIANEYTVFEKDQILTEDQLNSVTNYLDDQDRLSRVHLCGIGIACGLRVTQSGSTVQLSPGVGITSDGDLISFSQAITFNRFKAYDTEAPRYEPFYSDSNSMLPLYELVESGATDPAARPLSSLQASTGSALGTMTGLLLVESYVKDYDLCSGTDCDNRGQQYVSRTKLLLVSRANAAALLASLPTPRDAVRRLAPLWASRPAFSAAITSSAQLSAALHTAANSTHQRLIAALPSLWTHCAFLLQDAFSSDPTRGWITQLNRQLAALPANNVNISYYYQFLKDLVDTWNEMLEQLNTDSSWCNPRIAMFAKHLLVGDLVPGTDREARRTPFYPATANSVASSLQQAVFLARKLDAMIAGFAIPAGSLQPAITPSRAPVASLQARAIPAYYNLARSAQLLGLWNHALSQQDKERYNYSVHAAGYGAQGAAAAPLDSCLGGKDFFRIEGHLGKNFTAVLRTLQVQIRSHNLPFAVHGVLLGGSRNNLLGRRGAGYTDLNRLHYLSRQELAHRLTDVRQFSGSFKQGVDNAVASGTVKNDVLGNDGSTVRNLAASKDSTVTQKAQSAETKLNRSYAQFAADPSWMTDVNDAAINAGQFKYELGKVVKTEFVTPFDGLIADVRIDRINWLDVLIRDKDERADNENLFSNFIARHPGLESTGGVLRGGTFILLYDTAGTVAGDLMLSYHYQPEPDEAPAEPPLTRPQLPRDWIIDRGIKINPSLDNVLVGRLDLFKRDLDKEISTRFDLSKIYTDIYKESLVLVKDLYTIDPKGGRVSDLKHDKFGDAYLDVLARDAHSKQELIRTLDDKLADPAVAQDDRVRFAEEKVRYETELARDIGRIAKYAADSDLDVTPGTDGYRAVQVLNESMGTIAGNTRLMAGVKDELAGVRGSSTNANIGRAIGNLVTRF